MKTKLNAHPIDLNIRKFYRRRVSKHTIISNWYTIKPFPIPIFPKNSNNWNWMTFLALFPRIGFLDNENSPQTCLETRLIVITCRTPADDKSRLAWTLISHIMSPLAADCISATQLFGIIIIMRISLLAKNRQTIVCWLYVVFWAEMESPLGGEE